MFVAHHFPTVSPFIDESPRCSMVEAQGAVSKKIDNIAHIPLNPMTHISLPSICCKKKHGFHQPTPANASSGTTAIRDVRKPGKIKYGD